MRLTGRHGDKADKARLLTLVIPQSHGALATQSPLNREVHYSLYRREGLLRDDLREEERTERRKERCLTQGAESGWSGRTKYGGKVREWSLERPEGEREELREEKDRIWRPSRKSLGKAQKDFADAGEDPTTPGETQPRD